MDKSISVCRHCKAKGHQGTHGGCKKCGKVKHTSNGKKNPPKI